MKRLVEALLLIASIGGGFTGFCIVLGEIVKATSFSMGHFIIYGSALFLFAFFVYAGLAFAANKANIKPLKIAFLLQIPWVSSPILVYKLASGFSLSGILHFGGFQFVYNLGSDFNFGILNGQPWGIGFNLAAVILFFLASKFQSTVPNNQTL